MSSEAEDQDVSKDTNTSYLVADGASWYNKMISEAIETWAISSSMDKVAATLHAFMLELGFINIATDIVQTIVPDGLKTPAGYVSKYKYPLKPEPPVVLNVTSMGQILKVHGTNLSTKETFSSSIKVSIFVRKEDDKDHQVDPWFLASLVVTMTGFQVAWELAQVPTSDFQDPDLILQVLTSPNFLLEGEAEDLLVEAWEEVLGVVLEDSCKDISLSC